MMGKIASVLYVCILLMALHTQSFAQTAQVGKATYATSGNFAVPPTTPFITDDFSQKIISAKWWVTLMTMQYSWPVYAHPLSFQANSGGLDMGYPGASTVSGADIVAAHSKDLTVGIDGLNADAARVASYSHFGVIVRWTNAAKVMEATLTQGIPFAYYKITGGTAKITFSGTPNIWYNQAGVIGATINGKNYGIFAPTGSSWSGTTSMTSTLNGKNYLSVAVLPDNTQATLTFFRQYAYSFVKDTRVNWVYDETRACLTSVFSVVTDIKEGTESGTVFALMRHQWTSTSVPLTQYTYQSARGIMKVATGQSFQTNMTFNGILLSMPDTGFDAKTLQGLVQNENIPTIITGGSYNKDMGKYAQLAQIADLAGNTIKRDAIIKCLEAGLQEWFTAGGQCQFYYHKPWNRLIGYPAGFYSDTRLCDHHFHYGYFLKAAAIVAQWDPNWAKQENWGGMVNMLIRDVNSWDDNDSLFGRFAYFEPYEGHGWADPTGFERGTNQESSSESMNFNAALILWGTMTGNKTLRDEGIFMYANEARAIEQYWWDVDGVTFPSAYPHTTVGMVWSNGGSYSTWFDGNTGAIHGINFLPNTAGHLYLGRCPDYIPKNYNEGFSGKWPDLFYEFLAYSDPVTAMQKYNAGTSIEEGSTRPACYLEISSLNTIGRLDTQVVGSVPTFAVFNKGNVRTYCAYNPDATSKTVTFNDGFSMAVPAGKQIHRNGPVIPIRPVSLANSVSKIKPSEFVHTEKIFVSRGKLVLPRPGDNITREALYDLRGKKVWESAAMIGGDIRLSGSVRLPVQGIYILKQYK